jgi:hypothetical protein
MKTKSEFRIRSISYVHNPDAAKEWFDIYVEILMKKMYDRAYIPNRGDIST